MSMRLHRDEVPVDRELVRRLLGAQHPTWAGLDLRLVDPPGTDNVVFRLGDELSVRLPRKQAAVPGLVRELRWLPRIAPSLPLAVPEPVAAGEPGEGYPFPWAICRWVPGSPPNPDDLDPSTARVLGEFVAALHAADPTGGPPAQGRGGPVAAYDGVARRALDGVRVQMRTGRLACDELDLDRARAVWDAAVATPGWSGAGVWLHRDLHAGNLLADERGRVTGVLDFGGLALGDPAANLMAAWHLLPAARHPEFWSVTGADGPAVARARGWALTQGVEALTYYLDTHPGMVAMARRVLAQLAPAHPDRRGANQAALVTR